MEPSVDDYLRPQQGDDGEQEEEWRGERSKEKRDEYEREDESKQMEEP